MGQFTAARAGDLCTVSGPEYPLDYGSPVICARSTANWFVCRTGARTPPPIARAEARLYDEEQQNAWRGATDSLLRSCSWQADKLLRKRGHFNTVLWVTELADGSRSNSFGTTARPDRSESGFPRGSAGASLTH